MHAHMQNLCKRVILLYFFIDIKLNCLPRAGFRLHLKLYLVAGMPYLLICNCCHFLRKKGPHTVFPTSSGMDHFNLVRSTCKFLFFAQVCCCRAFYYTKSFSFSFPSVPGSWIVISFSDFN
jgi:hypothetical protein